MASLLVSHRWFKFLCNVMNKSKFEKKLNDLADTWINKDYERAANHFAESVKYADPLRYSFGTKQDLLEFFKNDEGYSQSVVWHNILFDEEKQVGVGEYTYVGTHRYHGLVIVKVDSEKITHWREYQHISRHDWEEFVSGTAF